MDGIFADLGRASKRRMEREARKTKDARLRTRYLIILNLADGRSVREVATSLHVARDTVYRVANRFRDYGEAGLIDRREDNGQTKVDEDYLGILYDVVASCPLEHGWKRPTWTREMLVITMEEKTGIKIHVSRMSCALTQIGARRGSPKPTVECPWSKHAKERKLRVIRRLIENLPEDEVAVYEDEVDIHLNPKIGLDWMVCGQQKEVPTPGQNQKRYLAGAQDTRTGELIWVEADSKNSLLFICLLWKLTQRYPSASVIHVVLDNYSIHHTEQVKKSLATREGQRIKLHFLPPYCPDHNKIERAWQDLHANVTRNHRCESMRELMQNVRWYLNHHNRVLRQRFRNAA